jgi:hypothetical protein
MSNTNTILYHYYSGAYETKYESKKEVTKEVIKEGTTTETRIKTKKETEKEVVRNYSLESLKNGTVSFAHIDLFNDPCEIALENDKNLLEIKQSEYYELYKYYFRVFCFSETYTNPIMWGHYGNSHQGFCVGYEAADISNIPEYKNSLASEKVNYVDKIPPLTDKQIEQGEALYYKDKEWSYEKEYRASIALHDRENWEIEKSEYWEAKENWLKDIPCFERAVDLRYQFHKEDMAKLEPQLAQSYTREQAEKETQKWYKDNYPLFDYNGYTYSQVRDKPIFMKRPSRISCSLKAKVIYIGLRTPDRLVRELKTYAKENNIEIYHMTSQFGEYKFGATKILL